MTQSSSYVAPKHLPSSCYIFENHDNKYILKKHIKKSLFYIDAHLFYTKELMQILNSQIHLGPAYNLNSLIKSSRTFFRYILIVV